MRHSSIKEFCERHPAFEKNRINRLVFNRTTNGLEESGAIRRKFHSLYINEKLFFEWLKERHKKSG